MNLKDGLEYRLSYRIGKSVNEILNLVSTHQDTYSGLPELQRWLHYAQSCAQYWHLKQKVACVDGTRLYGSPQIDLYQSQQSSSSLFEPMLYTE
jgi:hypothetical protein